MPELKRDLSDSGENIIEYRLEKADDGEDLLFEDFNWSQLKLFLDELIHAISVMPGSIQSDAMMPVKIEKGSLAVRLRGREDFSRADHILRAGPDQTWSLEMLQGTHGLYSFLNKRRYNLSSRHISAADAQVIPFRQPERVSYSNIVEIGHRFGRILRVGGKEGHVRVEFDDPLLGVITCVAGQSLAKKIARHLYSRGAFQLELQRHPVTRKLPEDPPQIVAFESFGDPNDKAPREALSNLLDGLPRNFNMNEFHRKAWKTE
jgi:hypothetical protein